MAKINSTNLRREKAGDLRLLGEVLLQNSVCPDAGPLMSSASQCTTSTPHGPTSWGYEIINLQFRSELKRNIFPENVVDVSVLLSLVVSGSFGEMLAVDDVIVQMNLDVVISGRRIKDGQEREVRCCWHLDKHVGGASQAEGIHPLYHFQHGGRLMEGFHDQMGSALLMDSPRLVHPPMDAFIAVDFVLANFLPAKWAELRREGAFVNRLARSYAEYWSPFFEAIAEAWRPSAERRWNVYGELCPQLLIMGGRTGFTP